MEIQFKHTPAGIVLCILEWNEEDRESYWEYYHLFEDACNGPFIGYCYVDNIIEFELEDEILIKFNSQKRIWQSVKPEESMILEWEQIDIINEHLKNYYALSGPPASA